MNHIFEIRHGPGNPKNSEGSFVKLNDGRFMLAYTKYRGTEWGDHCTAGFQNPDT